MEFEYECSSPPSSATRPRPSSTVPLTGWRLAVVQPLGINRTPEADPVVAADKLGAGPGQLVILNSDGRGAREMIGDEKSPVRFYVIGIVDE